MSKELSEMTLEELWELFPIFLVQPNHQWKEYYREIEAEITDLLTGYPVKRISHIGSTAIHGIWAKNIVDVMVEILESDMEEAARALERNGFLRMSNKNGRISLNKGYTKEGFADKVYHIHLRYAGDNDELYFRDFLNEHPQVAKEYEALKLNLWKRYEHDRDAYTEAKTDFVRRWTTEARAIYGDRY
ncbi:MAG: GrpB family protein [Clostridia bacterium]|nr:GrpB family protein [Clostridia bacterium]